MNESSGTELPVLETDPRPIGVDRPGRVAVHIPTDGLGRLPLALPRLVLNGVAVLGLASETRSQSQNAQQKSNGGRDSNPRVGQKEFTEHVCPPFSYLVIVIIAY